MNTGYLIYQYHRRDRRASAPILLHFHGGGFYSGNKAREARPLIRRLTSRRGFSSA